MKNKVIAFVCVLVVIILIVGVYFFTRKNSSYEGYIGNGESSIEFLPMDENPNVKQDVNDFDVTEEQDINQYAASVYSGEINSIQEVLVTDSAKYYVVEYADGYIINVTYSDGEYSFEETPTELDLEKSD